MTDTNLNGNLSTIAVWIWVFISPYLTDYITQDQFSTLFVAIVGLIIALYSSYNPNSFKFLNNEKPTNCICNDNVETVMNDEYVANITEEDDGGC